MSAFAHIAEQLGYLKASTWRDGDVRSAVISAPTAAEHLSNFVRVPLVI
jgi:hypothetical protein